MMQRPVFLFLHGFGGNASAWNPIRKLFEQTGYKTRAIDLLGHGKAKRPVQLSDYDLDNTVKEVLRVVADIPGPIVLVGHCYGGFIAQKAVLQQPKKFSALVLINSSAVAPLAAKRLSSFPGFRRLLVLFIHLSPRLYKKEYPDYEKFHHTGDYNLRRIFSDICHTSLKSYLSLSYKLLAFDMRPRLHEITLPTLLLHGEKDHIFRTETALYLKNSIPHSQLVTIPQGNHVMIWDYPEEIVEKILQFLSRSKDSETVRP